MRVNPVSSYKPSSRVKHSSKRPAIKKDVKNEKEKKIIKLDDIFLDVKLNPNEFSILWA